MSEIRYWDANLSTTTFTQSKKEQTEKVNALNNNFNQQMADLLMGTNNDPFFDAFNTDIPENIFGNSSLDDSLNARLSGIKNEGMEKVWAARMQSALPFSDMDTSYGKKKKDNDWMGGFGNIIELEVKAQMARAKKQLQHMGSGSRMSLEDFIAGTEGTTSAANKNEPSLDQFINDIQAQIEQAADKYGIDIEEIKGKIA